MVDYGNPLKKRQRSEAKKEKEEVIRPERRVLNASVCRDVLDYKGVVGDGIIRWVERWLVQLVRERSLPPQIAGCDVMAALNQYLLPSDGLEVLETIRRDFQREHPALFPKEDFSFLLKAFELEGIVLAPPYTKIL